MASLATTLNKSLLWLHVLCAGCLTLNACSDPVPAEQQLLQNLNSAKQAAENLAYSDLKKFLAPGFNIEDNHGTRYDQDRIKKTMTVFSFRKQKVHIILSANKVIFDSHNTQLAKIESTALVTGSRGLLPDDGRLYQLNSSWRLYKDEWLITDLNWK